MITDETTESAATPGESQEAAAEGEEKKAEGTEATGESAGDEDEEEDAE